MLFRSIEIVNEKDFGDTLKEEIFKPLNMKDTGFGVDEENLSRLMSTYGASNFKEIMNVGPHKLEETDVSAHNPYDSQTLEEVALVYSRHQKITCHLLECCYQVNLKVVKLYYQEIWLNL